MSKNIFIEKSQQKQSRNTQKRKQKKNNNNNRSNNTVTPQNGNAVFIARAPSMKISGPKIRAGTKRGSIILENREFVRTVSNNTGGFAQIARFRINPASKNTFPWLNKVAICFETYKFRKLKFHYIPRTATTTLGALMISPDYDAADRAPVTEAEATMNLDTIELATWQEKFCILKSDRMNAAFKQHYTADDSRFDASSQDQKTLDCAQVSLCCQEMSAGAVGKLWVEYEVELNTPQVVTDLPSGGCGTAKETGLVAGTANVFSTNAITVNNQEVEPIVSVLTNEHFPGGSLFKFNKTWQGFVDREINGTTLTNMGKPTKNGVELTDETIGTVINAAATRGSQQYHGSFVKGDLLGMSQVTAASIVDSIMNLGASTFN